ncbi:MAG TPA: peptide chain release factor N(5)-glutamine methyltransferase [Candidatus Doudnabacteria bacterium]|mgnify:CR=1 FL=1|nr:peptide chain release factor N(5)-glutamine methyltransferase [Candidatus Doudnabacteria bacterium]
MTVAQALRNYHDIEIELLLGHALKQSKEFLYLHPNAKLSALQAKRLNSFARRRRAGVPIAYLLGTKNFYGLSFKVNRSTLIPRPETEWLVEHAIKLLAKKIGTPQVLDIGTGSGCIAISIAKNYPKAKVFATDISEKALVVAKSNARAHRTQVKFTKQNLMTGDKKTYDIIIANLPYVPTADYKANFANLKYEPKSALVDSISNFAIYKKLLIQVPARLKLGGILLLEIDPTMKPLIIKWCKKNMPRAKIKFARDINKLWRYCQIG